MRRLSLTATFLVFVLSSLFLHCEKSFSFNLEKDVRKVILSNGLTVLMLARPMSPTVSLYIRHRVGAVDEPAGATGTAHFLEHLLFKGTKTIGTKNLRREEEIIKKIYQVGTALDKEKRKVKKDLKVIESLTTKLKQLQDKHRKLYVSNEIDRLYTENGAVQFNASTGQDVTTYHVNLPANKIELWARIEADRMVNPLFREFYQERDVIMEERRQSIESDPEGKLMEQFFATAFIAHPYRRPILGWPYDMANLQPDTVKNFLLNYHAPNNTVIAVVGDIDYVSTLRIIKKYFGKIKARPVRRPLITEEPAQSGERRIEVLFPANPQIIIGYHKPNMPHFDDYVFDLIDSILSQGRSSRLYKSLVLDKGMAESVQTANGMPGVRYPNLFMIFANPKTPFSAIEVEQEIYKQIDLIKNDGVSPEELEKCKNQIKVDYLRSLTTNAALASKLSYYETILGDFRYLANYLENIDKITIDDIKNVAKKYLTKENRTVAILTKK